MTITCYPPESDLLMGKSPFKMLLEFHQALYVFISWTMVNVSSRKPSKFAQACEQEKTEPQLVFIGKLQQKHGKKQ